MFGVMDFHRLGIDVGNEGVVSVGEFREFVGHGGSGWTIVTETENRTCAGFSMRQLRKAIGRSYK